MANGLEVNQNDEQPGGISVSGSLEEISLGIVVFHADGTSTDHGIVSRTNFKEQAEAEALAIARQEKNILKRLYGATKKKLKRNNNG